ncbi:MAG: dihydropteroate synthase [Armatimonadota bacterium]|jgi:dihydropteroate synthase
MEWDKHRLEFGARTLLMGIVNMTPDSFAGDGLRGDVEAAVDQAQCFAAEGADIIDVGGESTRPEAERVSAEEQIERTVPAIRAMAAELDLPISIDTTRAGVAEAALEGGAAIINDISALRDDPDMARLAAERGVPVVLMHMQGTPATMQQEPRYDDVVGEIAQFLGERIDHAVKAGIDRERIIVDPGIGFGKTVEHNCEILRRLGELRRLRRPLLVGTSRKSVVRLTLRSAEPSDLLAGTAATIAIAIHNGADIVRVHDVAHLQPVARMADAIAHSHGGAT